jgi:inactivated superfamily I helicase
MDAHIKVLSDALGALKSRGVEYDRNGGVEENFTRAAQIATLWLNHAVSPRDVALILASVKMARIASKPDHADSFVDLCNYVAFGAAFSQKEEADFKEMERVLAEPLAAE